MFTRKLNVLLPEEVIEKDIEAAAYGSGVRMKPMNRKASVVCESHQINLRAKVDGIFGVLDNQMERAEDEYIIKADANNTI
jgi:hypothetical protein